MKNNPASTEGTLFVFVLLCVGDYEVDDDSDWVKERSTRGGRRD